MDSPFETIDSVDLNFHGFQFNLLRNDVKLRSALFQIFFLVPLGLWVLTGWDGTIDQISNLLFNIPQFILGNITLERLIQYYRDGYGLGTHLSASVIYSLFLIGTSRYLADKVDVHGSENLALSTGFVGITIAVFEFYWMFSYSVFQGQHWVLSLNLPQLRIILQNVLFASPAILIIADITYYKRYRFNVNILTVALGIISSFLLILWWVYGCFLPVQTLIVGNWTSSTYFPQTMYTIDLYPLDNVAVGEMIYVGNDLIHLVNNLAKVFLTLTFYNLFKLKKNGL